MKNRKAPLSPTMQAASARDPSRHRSGAVARMLRMPVATLRVWERRYSLTQAILSPSGQRLYSAADVQRLTIVKQLTDLGHAIGSLAALNLEQLQAVASTHAQALATTQPHARPPGGPTLSGRAWRLAVLGGALGKRLKRPSLWRRLGPSIELLGAFDDAEQAVAALHGRDVDALLVHAPQLHEGWLAAFDAAAPALAALPKALLYGFAADPVCDALASAGTALLREPQPDAVLAQWLLGLARTATAASPAVAATALSTDGPPQRRWDDAALADFAGLSSTIACECPRHVAELLVQLSHFEAYSAECEQRNAADADLHAYLRQVASASRAQFEAALERVALHEGLMLPASTPKKVTAGSAPAPRPKVLP